MTLEDIKDETMNGYNSFHSQKVSEARNGHRGKYSGIYRQQTNNRSRNQVTANASNSATDVRGTKAVEDDVIPDNSVTSSDNGYTDNYGQLNAILSTELEENRNGDIYGRGTGTFEPITAPDTTNDFQSEDTNKITGSRLTRESGIPRSNIQCKYSMATEGKDEENDAANHAKSMPSKLPLSRSNSSANTKSQISKPQGSSLPKPAASKTIPKPSASGKTSNKSDSKPTIQANDSFKKHAAAGTKPATQRQQQFESKIGKKHGSTIPTATRSKENTSKKVADSPDAENEATHVAPTGKIPTKIQQPSSSGSRYSNNKHSDTSYKGKAKSSGEAVRRYAKPSPMDSEMESPNDINGSPESYREERSPYSYEETDKVDYSSEVETPFSVIDFNEESDSQAVRDSNYNDILIKYGYSAGPNHTPKVDEDNGYSDSVTSYSNSDDKIDYEESVYEAPQLSEDKAYDDRNDYMSNLSQETGYGDSGYPDSKLNIEHEYGGSTSYTSKYDESEYGGSSDPPTSILDNENDFGASNLSISKHNEDNEYNGSIADSYKSDFDSRYNDSNQYSSNVDISNEYGGSGSYTSDRDNHDYRSTDTYSSKLDREKEYDDDYSSKRDQENDYSSYSYSSGLDRASDYGSDSAYVSTFNRDKEYERVKLDHESDYGDNASYTSKLDLESDNGSVVGDSSRLGYENGYGTGASYTSRYDRKEESESDYGSERSFQKDERNRYDGLDDKSSSDAGEEDKEKNSLSRYGYERNNYEKEKYNGMEANKEEARDDLALLSHEDVDIEKNTLPKRAPSKEFLAFLDEYKYDTSGKSSRSKRHAAHLGTGSYYGSSASLATPPPTATRPSKYSSITNLNSWQYSSPISRYPSDLNLFKRKYWN